MQSTVNMASKLSNNKEVFHLIYQESMWWNIDQEKFL